MKLFEPCLPSTRHEGALLLDLDGLTLDTELPQRPVYQRIFRDLMGIELAVKDFAWALGKSYPETVEGINERFGGIALLDPTAIPPGQSLGEFAVAKLRVVRARERDEHGIEVMPHVPELLDWADSISLPRGIATSRHREVAHEMVEAANLVHRLHVLVGDGTEGVKALKPAPDIHQVGAKMLDTKPRNCWALEDSPPGVAGAWEAGTKVVYVPDERVAGPCAKSRRLAAFTARSMEDALNFLQREL